MGRDGCAGDAPRAILRVLQRSLSRCVALIICETMSNQTNLGEKNTNRSVLTLDRYHIQHYLAPEDSLLHDKSDSPLRCHVNTFNFGLLFALRQQ